MAVINTILKNGKRSTLLSCIERSDNNYNVERYEEKLEHLKEYLRREFGGLQACYEGGDNWIYMPPQGTIITVERALETCHESSGRNLDKVKIREYDQDTFLSPRISDGGLHNLRVGGTVVVIPPGEYEVGKLECGGIASHTGTLRRLSDEVELYFLAGYSNHNTIDWREVKTLEK